MLISCYFKWVGTFNRERSLKQEKNSKIVNTKYLGFIYITMVLFASHNNNIVISDGKFR